MAKPRKTSLYHIHESLGAKMIDFAGYLMPIQYSGIKDEHHAVRTSAGIFDVSHMGEFFVSGSDAEAFLDTVTVGNVSGLHPGDAQYSLMCTTAGGIIDDLLIYKKQSGYLLVVNAANTESDFAWLNQNIAGDVEIQNISDDTSLIAVQGPASRKIIGSLADCKIDSISFYKFQECLLNGHEVLLARTGYTGELGYEIYFDEPHAPEIWSAISDAGGEEISPAGLGCRDTLRMEMKYCLYGNDIDQNTNPAEAGLKWTVDLNKPHFIGKDAIVANAKSPSRRLVCIQMSEKAVPRQGYSIWKGTDQVGVITSGTMSPSLGIGIGLGYVDAEHSKTGTELSIDIRGKQKSASIVKAPFYKNGSLHD
ncbi:MAG: glycine cleavage system aminomethyltransferase GcvT [Candidatus Marinimicrobia bacterium]|jgi:aminomethyltransferase|nr:glycine cleavage system aminomethyltransferase GcvT [Candidatus Neomarinimicrobiota bacterium]MDP6789846.1 glycine cleavage system aminomethyltransferase GcvT [Candidatus Neomarinimicrobiota bacterium]MDP7072872.1 glycine cleavage system aminomethyltransferase GcvT [Candidatus Neomarinimicrobiota bacterium]